MSFSKTTIDFLIFILMTKRNFKQQVIFVYFSKHSNVYAEHI
jgi:hypothetical protein